MRLIATKKFTYAKKVLQPGDSFTASAEDARLLKGWGKAIDYEPRSQGYHTAELKADEPEEVTTVYKGRGRYRRTDMRPED